MSAPIGLLLLGFGGHARSVADVAMAIGVRQLRFVDPAARPGEQFAGHPVDAAWPDQLPAGWAVIGASGSHAERHRQLGAARGRGWPLATIVSRTATVGPGVTIGEGSFVGHHAHLGPLARIGQGVIINTGAIVEHDCVIGDYTHVSVRAAVAGRVHVGQRCFICAGSTLIDRVTVCDDVTVGAGAAVVADIARPGTYVGVPARPARGTGPA